MSPKIENNLKNYRKNKVEIWVEKYNKQNE